MKNIEKKTEKKLHVDDLKLNNSLLMSILQNTASLYLKMAQLNVALQELPTERAGVINDSDPDVIN